MIYIAVGGSCGKGPFSLWCHSLQNKGFIWIKMVGKWCYDLPQGAICEELHFLMQVIPGKHGFIAQLNEGRHLKKRPTEFRVDQVLQPFDGNKFNFTKVGQEEVLFRFEESENTEATFFESTIIQANDSPSVVAINVI